MKFNIRSKNEIAAYGTVKFTVSELFDFILCNQGSSESVRVNLSQWIASKLRHGMIEPQFSIIPSSINPFLIKGMESDTEIPCTENTYKPDSTFWGSMCGPWLDEYNILILKHKGERMAQLRLFMQGVMILKDHIFEFRMSLEQPEDLEILEKMRNM